MRFLYQTRLLRRFLHRAGMHRPECQPLQGNQQNQAQQHEPSEQVDHHRSQSAYITNSNLFIINPAKQKLNLKKADTAQPEQARTWLRNPPLPFVPLGIHEKFPLGQGGRLTDQEAMDVAEYFTHQLRPDFPAKLKN